MWLVLTGATGFVGRNFLLRAIADGTYRKIILPVRSREKLRAQFLGDGFEGIPALIQVIESAVADWGLAEPLRQRPPGMKLHVVHCAGTNFARTREEYFKINVEGTIRLLTETMVADATLVMSSQAAAGPCPAGRLEMSEGDVDAPVTFYGESKLALEQAALSAGAQRPVLLLRPPMILGARDTATLPLFKMAGLPVRFKPGKADKRFSFIAVGDLVSAMSGALNRVEIWPQLTFRKFFVASDTVITDRELIATCARAMRKQGWTLSLPQSLLKVISRVVDAVPVLRDRIPSLTKDRAKEIWPSCWVASPRAFSEAFKWKATQSLESALRDAFDWYRKTGQLRGTH